MHPRSRTEFRIAIICALVLEAEAVEALFDETYDKFGRIYGKRRGDANSYINGKIGKHNVVLCYMPGMGNGSAASVASSLRVSYTGVQLALVVGICGGAPNLSTDQDIFLGDVIVSNALVEYDFGRQYPGDFKRKSDALRRPDREIRTLLAALSTSRARAEFQEEMLHHLHKIQQQGTRWHHPGSADILFETSYHHKHYDASARCCCIDNDLCDDICEEAIEKNCDSLGCDENRVSRRRDKTSKASIHIGKVATADTVMKSGEHRDTIISKERVIGFEMEGAGVWDNISCIIIKGVCDYADSHKNKTWQDYAAATGASTAKAFLEYWRPVDREEYLVEYLSQSVKTKLPMYEASSRSVSTSLQVFRSESSAMRTPLQDIQNTVSGFEARFETLETLVSQLVHQPVISGSQQETNPAVITGRLLGKPGVLKDICDAIEVRQRPASSEMTPAINQYFGNTTSRNIGRRFSCMCRSLRRFQRKTIVHGSLAMSSEMTTEWHLPGCSARQKIRDKDQRRRFSLTYTGLRHLLNLAVQISFTVTSGAGGGSFSPGFTYFPTVDEKTAPAWRMLSLLIRSHFLDIISWETLVSSIVSSIVTLFRAKKASPRAVDAENRSLIYLLAKCVIMSSQNYQQNSLAQAKPDPLLELLDYLLLNKAPANDFDLSGHTPLSSMFIFDSYCSGSNPRTIAAAEAILQSNIEANVACLKNLSPAAYSVIWEQSGERMFRRDTAALLHFLSFSTKVAEAYGCGPLSLAILSNNLDHVEYLVRNHPATLAERDLFGYTPLHLAADKPSCLRILVTAADTRILNETDRSNKYGKSVLETAVFLSGLRCRERRSGRMCRRCRCAECAVILLKADCALPVPENLQIIFRNASIRCKRRYVRHMKDRRDRLKMLALDNLPATEIEQLGLVFDRVLDSRASRVAYLLQDRGVCIPGALSVTRTKSLSVYQALCSPHDAELFFQVGFHDTDSWCDCNTDAPNFDGPHRLNQDLPYLHWLAKHGAMSCQLKSLNSAMNTFTANYTYWRLGEDFHSSKSWELDNELSPFSLAARIAWVHELNAVALSVKIANTCDCRCSGEGCTPFISLFKGMSNHHRDSFFPEIGVAENSAIKNTELPPAVIRHFTVFLKHFGSDLEFRHHTAALRYLTYTALGIPHTCCGLNYKFLSESDQDAEEFENEHAYELELLEQLMCDFERQIIAIFHDPNQGVFDLIEFWECTWTRRMREILDCLEGDDLGDEERRKAEEIGVVWDEPRPEAPKVVDNPYKEDTLDHWMYELEKIEAEC